MAAATSVLVSLFWILFKEFILKLVFLGLQRPKGHITKAEIKIFVIMCYYVVLGILTLSAYSYYLTTDDKEFQSYFACQSIGIQPDRDCGDAPDVQLQKFTVVSAVSYILQSLLPLVFIIFITNCNCCSKKHLKTSKSKNHAAA